MSYYINLNGKLLPAGEARISPENRAFRYGYGVFETMLVRDDRIRLEGYHWERLRDGMNALGIQCPRHLEEELKTEIGRTVRRNSLSALCRVRLQVWGGSGGFYDGDSFGAQYLIEPFSLDPAATGWNENGLVAGIADAVKPTGGLSHLKTCSALPYVLAARQARAALWNDALLLNERGNIADSTIANIFWIEDVTVCTTPLTEGCVGGVMRRHLLESLPALGYEVAERPLRTGDLSRLKSVFLCNAVRGVKWLKTIADRDFQAAEVRDLWKKIAPTLF